MGILKASLKQTVKSSPYVLKEINKYFGFYFIGFSLFVLFSLGLFSSSGSGDSSTVLFAASVILNILSKVFIVFMIPYYAYKSNNRDKDIRPFWTFIRDTVWPVVFNQIKAVLVILLFFLFLIIPGVYKAIRYTFLIHTVFFDDLYKQNQLSALKAADKTTRGYFWLIILALICGAVFAVLPEPINFVFPSFLPPFIKSSFSLVVKFYFSCLVLLFHSQFYFALKKHRGESISC